MTITVVGFLVSFLIGVGIGLFYFYGLWWTIRKLPTVRQPGLWTFASFLLRTGVSLVAFYYSMQGQWQRLLVSLVGFTMTRALLARRFRPALLNPDAGKVEDDADSRRRGSNRSNLRQPLDKAEDRISSTFPEGK